MPAQPCRRSTWEKREGFHVLELVMVSSLVRVTDHAGFCDPPRALLTSYCVVFLGKLADFRRVVLQVGHAR